MKKRMLFLTVLSLLVALRTQAQECGNINTKYSRNIPSTTWTWGFDGNVTGVRYSDGSQVSADDILNFIRNAVSQWTSAANAAGTRITMTETSHASADLKVQFLPLGASCGEASSPYSMDLNTDYRFSSATNWGSTILHEMGHVFLGGGHHSGPGIMSDAVGNDCDKKVLSLSQCETNRALDLYNPNITFNVKNVFGDGSGGGQMIVAGESITLASSGYTQVTRRTSLFPLTLQAKTGQTSGGFPQNFTQWENGNTNLSRPITGSGSYDANFRDVYTVTVQTSGPAGVFGGQVRVNGGAFVNSPTTAQVDQGTSILVETITNQELDGLAYTFTKWTPLDYTTASASYLPSRTQLTFTANFNAKPQPPPGVSAGGPVGSYVQVTWSDHPHEGVTQYQIWRKVKHSQTGTWSGPDLLATVNRGTTSYTDYSYIVTSGYTHDLASYDVRS